MRLRETPNWLAVAIKILLLNFAGVPPLAAQSVGNYAVTRTTGIAYSSISAIGAPPSSWRNSGAFIDDDNRSFPIDIGFDFWYNGTRYTDLCVSTNGYIDFSNSTADGGPTGNPYGYVNTQFSQSNGTLNALAPFYDDMTTQNATDPLGYSIRYAVSGSAPNRVFTMEWTNMAVYQNTSPSLNFQVKLHETTGQIEYLYGTMTAGTANFSYTCGINAATMSGIPTGAQLKCQQTANTTVFTNGVQNGLTIMPTTNSKLALTPPVPSNPVGVLTFTGVATSQMTLNWANWASNEVGYVVYNSTDGVNWDFISQTAANASSYTATGLFSGTTYFWKVYAVTEGCLSGALSGTQATTSGSTFISVNTGNWNTGATWSTGTVPGANDNVIIANGHTVTVNGNINCHNLTINQGGAASRLLIGSNNISRTLNINGNIVVNVNGSLLANVASNTTHRMNLYGNITDNGIVNLASDANSFCDVSFLHPVTNQSIDGIGVTNNYHFITVDKGTNIVRIAEIRSSVFTAPNGFLTLVNGTFKISTTGAVNITPFGATTDIPLKGRLWVNSATANVNTLGTINLFGELRVSAGTMNIGSASNDCLTSDGGLFVMTGGAVNVASRFDRLNVATLTRFTITGGTLTLNTVGSTTAGMAPFMMDVIGSQYVQTGGLIIIHRSGAGNLGFLCTGGVINTVSGGVVQMGDATTPAGQTIQVNTVSPIGGFRVASANVTASLITNPLTVFNDVELQLGNFLVNNLNVTCGGNWTNTGGTYTFGTNTTTFNNPGNSAINGTAATQTFNNLVVNKGSGNTLSTGGSTTTINVNNFTETSGNFTAPATLNVNTSATSAVVLTAGTFTFGTIVNITGNWTNNGATTVPGNSTTNFTGTGAQQITGSATSQSFNNITLLKTAGTTLTVTGGTTTLNTNSITETTGNFTAPATLNATASSTANILLATGTFTAGATINVNGNWTNNGGTFVPGTGIVNFTGSLAQLISGTPAAQSFYNVGVIKTGGSTLSCGGATVTLNTNNFTLTSGNFTAPAALNINRTVSASLLISSGNFTSGATININGNWTQDGGNVFPGSGVVNFIGTANQQINGAVASQSFNNITILKAAATLLNTGGSLVTLNTNNITETSGSFTAPQALNITATPTANLLLTSGTFTAGTTINIKGDWTKNGGTFVPGTGVVNFTGTGAQTINGTFAAQTFYDINVIKSAGSTLTVSGSTTTLNTNNFTQTSGNFISCPALNITVGSSSSVTLISGTFTFGTTTNVTGNWTDNGATTVPGTGSTYFISNGLQQILGTASENFNNLFFQNGGSNTIGLPIACSNITIVSGDSLSVGNPGYTITARGNWSNSGNFNPGTDGTVIFAGASSQSIGGTSSTVFRNMTLNNSAGAALAINTSLRGTLTLTLGIFTTTGYNFTLISDVNGTARIAEITGGDIIGNIRMQRYIYLGPTGWRQLSSAVTGNTFADWNDDLVTSGFPGSDFPSMSFYSIAKYDETAPGVKENGYSAPSNVTNPIVARQGYFVYVGPLPVPVTVVGPAGKFNQSYTLTYTPSAGFTEDGWNMVANPYPSSIDWDAAGWTRTNTDAVLSMWNPVNRQYSYYVGGVGVNGGSKNIPSCHAFWVHTIGPAPAMSITESVKTAVDQPYMRSAAIATNNDLLSLSILGTAGIDQTIIRFNSAATDTFDIGMDAIKLASTDTTVPYLCSITSNAQDFAINTLPAFTSDITVPLHVTVGVTGNYSIRRDSITDLPASMCVTLEDRLNGTFFDLAPNTSYPCHIVDTTDAVRFILHFGPALGTGSTPGLCTSSPTGSAWASGVGVGPWDYTWTDLSGNVIASASGINGADTLHALAPGSYIVTVDGNSGNCSTRMDTVVVSGPDPIEVGAQFTPSTCAYTTDGAIGINIITGGTAPYTLQWPDGSAADSLINIPSGNYQLHITDNSGCVDTIDFILPSNSDLDAGFSVSTDTVVMQGQIQFSDTSNDAFNFNWDFGDGSPQTTFEDPLHAFDMPGDFVVTLIADDGICFDTAVVMVHVIDNTGIANTGSGGTVLFASGAESFDVLFDLPAAAKAVTKVYDMQGQLYYDGEFYADHNRESINMTSAAVGVYTVMVQLDGKLYVAKMNWIH